MAASCPATCAGTLKVHHLSVRLAVHHNCAPVLLCCRSTPQIPVRDRSSAASSQGVPPECACCRCCTICRLTAEVSACLVLQDMPPECAGFVACASCYMGSDTSRPANREFDLCKDIFCKNGTTCEASGDGELNR